MSFRQWGFYGTGGPQVQFGLEAVFSHLNCYGTYRNNMFL